jgi:hypothetical protein
MTVTIKAVAAAGALLAQPGAAAAAPSRALAIAALTTWLLDASSGAYMLVTWIVRGGLRRQRAGDRLGPRVVFSHFGLATTGLLIWISFVVTRRTFLAWLAVGLLMLVIGLGVSTVTLWTPFPARRGDAADPGEAARAPGGYPLGALAAPAEDRLSGAVTDDMLARALTDEALLRELVEDVLTRASAGPSPPAPPPRSHLAALIPAGHGVAAIATMLLAALTAAGAG